MYISMLKSDMAHISAADKQRPQKPPSQSQIPIP